MICSVKKTYNGTYKLKIYDTKYDYVKKDNFNQLVSNRVEKRVDRKVSNFSYCVSEFVGNDISNYGYGDLYKDLYIKDQEDLKDLKALKALDLNPHYKETPHNNRNLDLDLKDLNSIQKKPPLLIKTPPLTLTLKKEGKSSPALDLKALKLHLLKTENIKETDLTLVGEPYFEPIAKALAVKHIKKRLLDPETLVPIYLSANLVMTINGKNQYVFSVWELMKNYWSNYSLNRKRSKSRKINRLFDIALANP